MMILLYRLNMSSVVLLESNALLIKLFRSWTFTVGAPTTDKTLELSVDEALLRALAWDEFKVGLLLACTI